LEKSEVLRLIQRSLQMDQEREELSRTFEQHVNDDENRNKTNISNGDKVNENRVWFLFHIFFR